MLDAVRRHYPARHQVMVDDKRHILAAMKAIWQDRLTTLFVRQGHSALETALNPAVAAPPAADFMIDRIGELADLDLSPLIEPPADAARSGLVMS